MTEQLLSEKDYIEILNHRFGVNSVKFINAVLKPLSEDVQGFMGEHYKLQISYETNGETKVDCLFIKTKPKKNLTQREFTNETNAYKVEIFLYSMLFREFEAHGLNTSFSPKCWYAVEEETFVMDDLSEQGYRLAERGKWYDLEESKCGLRSLALLHAAGVIYEEIQTKELGRRFRLADEYSNIFYERFFTFFTEFRIDRLEEWLTKSISLFCLMIDDLPESVKYKMEFKKRLQEREIGKIFIEKFEMRKTVGHGDLWSNNMLFKFENGSAKHCSLLDYQLSRYFYPSYDVMLFLYANTNYKLYSKEHPILLEYYYETLSNIFSEHDYNISDFFPAEEFKKSLEIVEFDTKLQAYSVMAFVSLEKKTLNEAVQTDDDDSYKKVLVDDRARLCFNAFKNDENYRKLMTDSLYAFHDCLFKN